MNNYKILQRTILKPVSFAGIGLHTGVKCEVTLKPSEPDSGIFFIRKDLIRDNLIPADFRNIHKSHLCTSLKAYNSDADVLTVEHLLAAIKGNGIDNLKIEIDCKEVPILDGSAKSYDTIIKSVGVLEQHNFYKKFLIIKNKVSIKNGKSIFCISPSKSLEIDCMVDFPEPIGKQSIFFKGGFEDIYKNVKDAKTFCYFEDIEMMKRNGLAQGGSLENAIVIKNGMFLNPNFKNSPNYFAKHKTLDILGDISLIDLNIVGKISVCFPGHEVNKLGMQKIFAKYSNYSIYQHNNTKDFSELENSLSAC